MEATPVVSIPSLSPLESLVSEGPESQWYRATVDPPGPDEGASPDRWPWGFRRFDFYDDVVAQHNYGLCLRQALDVQATILVHGRPMIIEVSGIPSTRIAPGLLEQGERPPGLSSDPRDEIFILRDPSRPQEVVLSLVEALVEKAEDGSFAITLRIEPIANPCDPKIRNRYFDYTDPERNFGVRPPENNSTTIKIPQGDDTFLTFCTVWTHPVLWEWIHGASKLAGAIEACASCPSAVVPRALKFHHYQTSKKKEKTPK